MQGWQDEQAIIESEVHSFPVLIICVSFIVTSE